MVQPEAIQPIWTFKIWDAFAQFWHNLGLRESGTQYPLHRCMQVKQDMDKQ